MASSSGNSELHEQDAETVARNRRLLQLDCVNKYCQHGDNPSPALYFVCSYYNVTWKNTKKVCEHCLTQCLQHYKRLELKFKNRQCILDDNFPCYDSNMISESSSSEDEEPMPSTSQHGLSPDEECTTAVEIALGIVLEENSDLIDTQIKLCNDYLNKEFEVCMREGDEIDDIANQLENDIKLLKSELYGPYEPIITVISSDSEQESVEKVIDVEEIEDVQVEKITDLTDNKEDEVEANKDKILNKKRKGENEKFEQNKVVVAVENKETETDQDVIAIDSHVCVIPTDLPNGGPFNFPPLQKGQKVFAMHLSLLLPWSTYTVMAVLNEKTVHIKSHEDDKFVATNLVAYLTQCPVQFKVGIRVIAKFYDQSQSLHSFYAGIIAEPPNPLNKFRYLIFFDNRHVQYVYHKHIRLIVGQTSEGVCFNVDPDFRKFIKNYVDQYPARSMVKLTNGDTVRVQYENKWVSAKVLEVDASLVKLHLIEQNCIEWLYRGSPRLWKMFEKLLNLEKGIRSRQSGLVYLKRPFVEYSSIEVPTRPARTVARKSTSKKSTSQHEKIKKSIPINNVSELKLLSLPKDCLVPKKIVRHTCSSLCVEWTEYNYMKTKQINILAVPLHFGFRRCLFYFNTSQKSIVYRTPCGLSIRSLKEMHDYLIKTKSMMTIDQFDFNSWVNPFAEFHILKNNIPSVDMSQGKEFRGISVVNTINCNAPPKMNYMTVRQAMPGVNINVESEFLCGCDCTDNCQDKSKCACWQLTIEGQKILPNLEQDPNIGYSYRRLPERVLTGIYECNKTCKCSKSCLNRVVQNPLPQKLQLFLTEKKGWGVRCLNDIPQGSFICIYVGRLLTETDANEGGINYGDEYLAELDYIEVVEKIKEDYETDVPLSDDDENVMNSESSSEDLQTTVEGTNSTYQLRKRHTSKNTTNTKNDGLHVRNPPKMKNNPKQSKSMREYFGNNESVYIIDAKTSGNIGRYFNHSCSPNVFVQNVFVDTHDLRFPWVCFFALHYIPAGTELTWDYNYDIGSVPGKMMKCHCESVYCRGRLL